MLGVTVYMFVRTYVCVRLCVRAAVSAGYSASLFLHIMPYHASSSIAFAEQNK